MHTNEGISVQHRIIQLTGTVVESRQRLGAFQLDLRFGLDTNRMMHCCRARPICCTVRRLLLLPVVIGIRAVQRWYHDNHVAAVAIAIVLVRVVLVAFVRNAATKRMGGTKRCIAI